MASKTMSDLVNPITDSRRVHPTINPSKRLWADIVPSSWKPFVQLSRVDAPSGAFLVFWPCAWGLLASAYRAGIPLTTTVYKFPGFFIGGIILRSMACTWNDICDKDFDAQVERTKHRPLAVGTVSISAALMFVFVQVPVFVAIASHLHNELAFKATILGLILWQPIYPLLKRITYWPQAWLPTVMNWGIVVGWAENLGKDNLNVAATLFLGSCCWTIYYDTLYATMDLKDDRRIGLKSTAVLFGSWTRFWLGMFCIGFVVLLVTTGVLNGQGLGYYVASVFPTALLFLWQIITWDQSNPQSAFIRFDQNGRYVGMMVASGLAVDCLLKFGM